MTALLRRIATSRTAAAGGRRRRKGWEQPPVWTLDALRHALIASPLPDQETIENDFVGYVQQAYKRGGPVFSVIRARQMVYSQARFAWQDLEDDTFSRTPDLQVLHKPWRNGITAHLLAKLEADVSLAGNAYVTRTDDRGRFGAAANGPGQRLVRMRPDWVTIIIGSPSEDPFGLDAQIVGYLYEPRGYGLMNTGRISAGATLLTADQVGHYLLHPDPAAQWRGMSWLSPVLDEIAGDQSAQRHKKNFFRNGATLQVIVGFDPQVSTEAFDHFVEKFREQHQGVENAYMPLFLGGGADPKVVSADMQQLDFRSLSGAAETRVASAGGAHPVVVGMSEGMQGSALNAGNFQQVRRLFVDGSLEWMWASTAGSLETIVPPPDGQRLVCDTRHVNFLRADRKDVAEIQRIQAIALRQLLDAGYDPDAAVRMIMADDPRQLLNQHSGRFSIQLQTTDEDGNPRPR